MNIKRNITFALECRKKDNEPIVTNVPIRMRVVYDGRRVDFSTGHRIDAVKWDIKKQRVKSGCSNKLKETASEINRVLDEYSSNIQVVFKEFEILEVVPTPQQLKDNFNKKNNKDVIKENTLSLQMLFFIFISESSVLNNWTESTIKKLTTVKRHLNNFDKDLTFENLSLKSLDSYVAFLHKKNQRNTSIVKQISLLKWFLRWCIEKGYSQNNIFESFKPKLKTTTKKVIFLDWDELTLLRSYEIPTTKQYLERVRDVFLFQCYTGLRYSDVFNLKRSDVKTDTIEITTIKTADSLVIDLNDYSRSILEKYKNIHFENNKVLPVISNQKMNDYLKELAELVPINQQVRETYYKGNERIDKTYYKYELLGTHAGRRTFICNSLAMGIPAQTVMKWTGHSDYKAMKPYIDISDKNKKEAMKIWNKQSEIDQKADLLKELEVLSVEDIKNLVETLKK